MSASRADSSPDPATASDAIDDATATDAATDAAPFLLSPALHKPPALLPIARVRNELLHAIETWPVTIVVGQTGSGKTTQLPQFLLDAGWCLRI
ncbi:hypothetical protein KEM52_004496 [Ascosphaera acerosa]|nr:hypothetical protein KEM52_004496 [Ascosphaera acerosa]